MQQPIAFDTETHLFGPGNRAPRVVCVSTAAHGRTDLKLAADAVPLILQPLLGAARDGQAIAIGQNVAYDMACLLEQFPSELCNAIWQAYSNYGVHCTKIRERLIDIMRGSRFDEDGRKQYSLDALAKKRLGITLDKETWRLNYAQFDGVSITQWPQGVQDYATGDATATLGVWESQEAEIARANYPAWHDECARQSAFAFALYLTTCRGIMVDQERVRALKDSLTPRMMQARDVMIANGLLDAKKGSKITKAIRAAIEATWIGEGDIPRTDKTNQVQTALEVVEQCTHPGLAALAEYAGTEKLLSSFVLKLEEAGDKPIHGEYEPLGADTGRTSGRNPNLQQQPRAPGVRECFVARPGFVFVSCDYDSQELRTLAQVLKVTVGHSTLAERYAADPDYDPHTDFAARLVGITYTEAMARKKAKDKALLERRQHSKCANFGYPGGMGAEKFRAFARGYDLDLTLAQSMELREAWFAQYPEMREYFTMIGNKIDYGDTMFEQLYSGRLRGGCHFTNGCNTLFQGLAADASKSALWEATKRCYGAPGTEGSALFGCRPVVFVHDEIIIEAPEPYAHEAAVELDRVMCAAMQELTPDVPARASPALMRHWSKKSDLVWGDKEHGDEGRMICWDDWLDRQKRKPL
jgi:DNA polymerase-1